MITKLIKYQEIDKKLRDIENMLGASDERKHVFLSAKFLKSIPELVAKIDNKAIDLMNQLSAIKDKRAALSEQLRYIAGDVDNIETEESVHYTMKKADEIIASIKALDTACAKLSTEMASLSAEYDQVKVKTKKANEQYKEYNEKYTALKASVQGEMKQIQTELAELRKSIDPEKMKKYDVAVWAHHGMFAAGADFDDSFGLMHTVEKAAEILVKVLSMVPEKRQTITPANFRKFTEAYNFHLDEKFLYEK
jgi:chromosome segregation ATPase